MSIARGIMTTVHEKGCCCAPLYTASELTCHWGSCPGPRQSHRGDVPRAEVAIPTGLFSLLLSLSYGGLVRAVRLKIQSVLMIERRCLPFHQDRAVSPWRVGWSWWFSHSRSSCLLGKAYSWNVEPWEGRSLATSGTEMESQSPMPQRGNTWWGEAVGKTVCVLMLSLRGLQHCCTVDLPLI